MNLVGSAVHKYGMLEIQSYYDAQCAMNETGMCSFPIWPQNIRHIWSNVFKIFYDLPPILNNDGYDSILENCQALAELAEELQSAEVVCPAISKALLGFDQQLYRLIAQNPIAWVKLAVRVQSAPVFQESMVHLIGKWGLIEENDRELLPQNIRTLCTQKLHELNIIKKVIELRIVNRLPRPRSDSPRYRETSNYFGWMALTFYQQWLCESFAEGRNYHAPDGGAAFYRAIAAGGDAYLSKLDQDISHFSTSSGANAGSNKGLRELEKDLNELKKGMKRLVSDILINHAKYDPAILGELPYLTCCKVSEEEMPPAEATFGSEMGSQLQGFRNNMVLFPSNSNFHQTFFPAGPIPHMGGATTSTSAMMSFNNNHANNYPLNPGMQDNNPNMFAFNAFNQQSTDPTLIWENTVDFSSPSFNNGGPLPSISEITDANGIYQALEQAQTQTQFDDSTNMGGNLDMFDAPLLTGGHGYVQHGNDGSMAFL
ncbi:hypothetical protein BDW75DRAFT_228234 [Aspergillus navahoensis]